MVCALMWRYNIAIMAGDTATIRVTRQTRDLLAEQARRRGLSLASMLSDLAVAAEREEALRAEREAARADAGQATAKADEREWETTLGDGID